MAVSNEQIYNVLLTLKEDVGGIKNGLSANETHTLHVSRKVDGVRQELIEHISSSGAHGVAAEARGRAGVFAAVAIAGSVFGAIGGALLILKYAVKAVSPG